ncbi:DNA replication terminus site-binding protein [Candidatus Sodalis pierantonius str. SOPE]|uniref:DNA replication terminus site-binding protein n=1 Tax=Candidatus Sodalis pierantonii str. SOPE TaxID=2342 RepID=W0HPJ1_9GAMM|nr:DNA replication terminus site-binding protein [Candidatus Sodalis pierantonius]AHF74125.1 DNA replication terminus site-binding protein [Candidatus Sodalis pierantonius str. SOPE]
MPSLDLTQRLNAYFNTLQLRLEALGPLLGGFRLLAARVFTLPEVEKGQEQAEITTLEVQQQVGKTALATGLAHYQRLFIYHQKTDSSGKAAIRLPDALCFAVDDDQYASTLALMGKINDLKAQLAQLITVESQLPPEQRFDFVHRHLRGLKTLSAYRGLQVITDPDSVRFGWANKQVIKNLTRQEVLTMLQKSLQGGRAVPPYTREQWRERVRDEINQVSKLPPDTPLKIKRPVKVQPIARVWYKTRQKQVQYACPSPLIVLCRTQQGATVPALGELLNYDRRTIRPKHVPAALPAHLLIERLHLYVAT